MVHYECFRCGYNTKHRGHLLNHLNRKNVCKPLLENMDIIDVKMYYGFKLQTKKKPKITSIETKCETTTTDSSSEYSDISDTESDVSTENTPISTCSPPNIHQNPPTSSFLPQNTSKNPHQNIHQNPPKHPPKSTKIHQKLPM